MDFETNKIRNKNTHHKKVSLPLIGAGISILLVLILILFALLKSLDFGTVIFSFGQTLKTDAAGNTNILLTGVGGEGHDGADLTDTVMVASIDQKEKYITLLSIPRDFYFSKDNLKSGTRINEIYSIAKHRTNAEGGLDELKKSVSTIVGMPIQYALKVDFNGFKKIIDSLGGVDVTLEKDLSDPFYPKGETTEYETFILTAGPHTLDGETALKFARSRKTTSDFDRAKRQQQLLSAIKSKAISKNILTDPSKIRDLYNAVSDSISTDLSINEIIELARVTKDFEKNNIIPRVLSDDPLACGGLLYTPAREFFNGAFVLLPAGNNYDAINEFTKEMFYSPTVMNSHNVVQILNGTKIPNIAGEVEGFLSRMCVDISYFGNATNRELATSTIYYKPGPNNEMPPLLEFVKKYFPFKIQAGIPETYLNSERKQNTDIVIELGADYLNKRIKNPFDQMPLYQPSIQNTQSLSQSSSMAKNPAATKSSSQAKTQTTKIAPKSTK